MEQFNIIEWFKNISFMAHFPKLDISSLIEIIVLTTIFYYIAKSIRGTRAWILLKGVIIMLSFYALAYLANFNVIVILFQNILLFLGIAIVIIIQPELRKLIERIGTKNINVSLKNLIHSIFKDRAKGIKVQNRISDFTIQEIVKGCSIMGKAKTGALIVIEQDIPLNEYVESGIKVNADITAQLFINIFEHNTPLHDGAVIIQNDKISAATCYLPLSDSKKINKDLGTRHRAGIGISEVTDAFVVIVSEETGAISVAKNGKLLHNLDREKLSEELKSIQTKTTYTETKEHKTFVERNFPLKLACLFGTFFLWIMVITASNPVTSTTIRGIPVEIINTSIVIDTGKTYEILDNETVNVTIKDRKDIIDKVEPGDIKVIADFSKLSYVNSIPLEVIAEDYPDSEIYLSDSTMKISLEDIITTEVNVEINTVGEANEKYYISDIELDNETLIISGAKSVINTIGHVVIDIDESKLTSDTTLNITPNIFDKNGKQINNSKFTLNHGTIEAKIHLYKTKLVPLNITTVIENDVLSKIITNIDYEEKQIYITGPDEILDKYEEIDIEIPLDISLGDIAKSQFIKNVTLQNYLPEGVLVTPQFSKINLIIDFVDFYTKAIEFNTEQLSIEGINNKLSASIEYQEMSIDIVGMSKTIEDKTFTDIKPFINLEGLSVGEHEVTVEFKELKDNIIGNLTVKVTIENKG